MELPTWNRVVFLSIIAAMGVISATLCAPALPFIADHFSTNFSKVQFTISLFLVGSALGQFASGPLSDHLGQRAVLLGGLLLYIFASCGCALAESLWGLLTARFLQGMGSAVGPVLARSIASSSYSLDRSAQVQSYGAMGVGIASMLAILSSGQITLISWRGNFWLAAGLGVLLALWALRALPSASPRSKKPSFSLKQVLLQMREITLHPGFFKPALCHAMTYGLMYGYIALFPFLLAERLGENNPAQVGFYSAIMIAFYMLGAFFASHWALRRPSGQLIAFGIILQLISGTLLALTPVTFPFFAALFLFNVSIGIILPLTSARALAPFAKHGTGAASSTLGLAYRLLGSGLSALICYFPLAGGKSLGLFIALLSLCSLVLWRALPELDVTS